MILDAYKIRGYHHERSILKDIDLSKINSFLLGLIQRHVDVEAINCEAWVAFAKENPAVISKIYEVMSNNILLLEIGALPSIVDLVKKFIHEPLLYKKIPFRIDVPFETKELAYWHQDDFYVKGNDQELTVWIPLDDVPVQAGCLSVMPGSHTLKKVPHTIRSGKKYICESVYDREIRLIEMARGDALFFSSYLIHSSNLNFSSKIRYSIQLRYTSSQLAPSNLMKGTIDV